MQEKIEIITFEDDLQYVADRASERLNMFADSAVANNKMITRYGNDEFIALILTPKESMPGWSKLRLRTKDMAAEWDNVPLGFSQINESRGLFSDIRKAAKVSLKRNCIWYIDQQIKNVVGDRVVFTELTTNKGYLYKISFTNGFVTYLTIVRDDKEYYKPHDVAKLYMLTQKNKEPISAPMTADECIMMLVNVAMQTDKRVAEFISVAEQCGGKTMISHSYRTEDTTVDEARAVFANNYALKLRIQNNKISLEALGKYNGRTEHIDERLFKNIQDVYDSVREFALLPQYTPIG